MVNIKVLKKGDSVLNVTENGLVIKRKNGDVDLIPVTFNETYPRIDLDNIIKITYGNNVVENIDDKKVVLTF